MKFSSFALVAAALVASSAVANPVASRHEIEERQIIQDVTSVFGAATSGAAGAFDTATGAVASVATGVFDTATSGAAGAFSTATGAAASVATAGASAAASAGASASKAATGGASTRASPLVAGGVAVALGVVGGAFALL